jgi:sec-independent protein translocase protein TatA
MSTVHILLLVLVAVLIFGTKKLRNLGSDLGGTVRDFKKGLHGEEDTGRTDGERLRAEPLIESAPPSGSAKVARDFNDRAARHD